MLTNISETHAAFIFSVELQNKADGSSDTLLNVLT